MRFPRQLEADYGTDAILRVLMDRTAKLWSGGALDIPFIAMADPMKKALRAAMLRGHIRWGLEGVSHKLSMERAGIVSVQARGDAPHGERISRLILLSNDGAERFYRHAEQLLLSHAPRLLGCLLDTDSSILGNLVTGKEREIKLVMVDHKDAVSEILRAMLSERVAGDEGQRGSQKVNDTAEDRCGVGVPACGWPGCREKANRRNEEGQDES
jgi:hypothetical protein